jgi:DNA helicase TIP49 (TBP-interacting protein)
VLDENHFQLRRERYDLLQRYIIEGKLHFSNTEAILKSEIISQTIHLPSELFDEIDKMAKKRSVSTQEQLILTVVQGLKSLQREGKNDVHISDINDR